MPQKSQQELNVERIDELQDYLDKTDWYAVRFAESGKAIPDDIAEQRNIAREEISALREEVE